MDSGPPGGGRCGGGSDYRQHVGGFYCCGCGDGQHDHRRRRRDVGSDLAGDAGTVAQDAAGTATAEEVAAAEQKWAENYTGKEPLPDGWTKTENNGFIHIRDAEGNIRIRIDPPDPVTNYPHMHLYDAAGNSLDANGNIVSRKSPDAHIPMK